MRPTSPSNRISAYYQTVEERRADQFRPTDPRSAAAYTFYYQQIDSQRRRSGRLAGIAASVLQLAISSLCVAAALSVWLGYSTGISSTTAVFLGGVMFGTVSLLQLYSALASVSSDATPQAYDD